MAAATFTIAIPTHDRRETVVLSVLSALRQTRSAVEVIVLCDGCTDGTAEAVRSLGPDVIALELEKGVGYAYEYRNFALDQARGTVITWLADDDLLLPDHLERLGEYWDAGVADLVTTPAAVVHPDDTLEWAGQDWSVPWHRDLLQRQNTNVMASVSIRADLARAVGGWDGGQERAGDWDLWKRALAGGARPAMTLEPTVLHFRASGRVQAWPLRVRQNTEWLERISDPAVLPDVRRRLRRLQGERDARQLSYILELESYRDDLHAEREALHAEIAEQRRRVDEIHAGGWWRLRNRLLPLMRLFGRGDA